MFKKVEANKCNNCKIGKKVKKDEYKFLARKFADIRKGTEDSEILIVLPKYESDKFIERLEREFLKNFGLSNYVIVSGIDCMISKTKDFSFSYDIYTYCDAVNLDRFKNLKVIITLGAGLFAITQTSDLKGWQNFKEFKFNQTYFYTGFDCDRKLRVYPLPHIEEMFVGDSFERYFADKQFKFIKKYLKKH
jgi:hypothetical protein